MTVLVFPDSPVNGQYYPPTPIPGVNQWQYDSLSDTWELVDQGSVGGVEQVNTGVGLTGGPITTTGTISLANTAVTPGSYTNANITIDAQGRITLASNGTSGGVTQVSTGTGLSGGPITTTGTISLANTAVTPGSYTNANITVDAQGRITLASNGTSGSVTQVSTGTGLTGGPITTTGTISLADTAVTPGAYTNANITVDAQGRITLASNGSGGGAGERRSDWVAPNNYLGKAPTGTTESSPTWELARLSIDTMTGAITIGYATDSWTNHLTATYI